MLKIFGGINFFTNNIGLRTGMLKFSTICNLTGNFVRPEALQNRVAINYSPSGKQISLKQESLYDHNGPAYPHDAIKMLVYWLQTGFPTWPPHQKQAQPRLDIYSTQHGLPKRACVKRILYCPSDVKPA